MKYTSKLIGEFVRSARKNLGVTQRDLAMRAGTGLRFIIELEQGKPTCQLGKVLTVLDTLGITIKLPSKTTRSIDETRPGVESIGSFPKTVPKAFKATMGYSVLHHAIISIIRNLRVA